MTRLSRLLFVCTLVGLFLMPTAPSLAANMASRDRYSDSWCGSWPWGIEVSLAKRQWNQRRLARGLTAQGGIGQVPFKAGPQVRQEGNVAIIQDDGSIVIDKNPFDYEDSSAKYLRRGKFGFKVKKSRASVGSSLGNKLSLGDDDSIRVNLSGFEIRFYGEKYGSFWINSDGNLTFEESDNASSARDIQRMLGGPPRVSALFADLDPSAASGEGGVYLKIGDRKVTVTWLDVPNFDERNSNTVQLIMNARGNAEIRFGEVDSAEGIVGVAPGGGSGLELIDLTEDLPLKRKGIAIAERFSDSVNVDESAVANTFYDHFADEYDQLVLFTDFHYLLGDSIGTIAYHMTVNNQVRGIGSPVYNASRFYGSNGRLGGFINMGSLNKYPSNLSKPTFIDKLFSSLDILAHEIGHQWLVGATFVDGAGRESENLLGRSSVHWSYYFNSGRSFLEGNKIEDNGDGTFTTERSSATYSPLDRYLMGLISASEVPDFWYVLATSPMNTDTAAPEADQTFQGTKTTVSIQDVLAAMGQRKPSVDSSPKEFRIGLILLARDGSAVSTQSVDKANEFAAEIERLFRQETDRRGEINTTLIGR